MITMILLQIGKIGTDIQDNKCSWLIVQALLVVNAKQRKVEALPMMVML